MATDGGSSHAVWGLQWAAESMRQMRAAVRVAPPSTRLTRRCSHALPLQGVEGAEVELAAAEKVFSDLQWRQFDLVTSNAPGDDRRSYRSLLFNLMTQRQLLRQVCAVLCALLRWTGLPAVLHLCGLSAAAAGAHCSQPNPHTWLACLPASTPPLRRWRHRRHCGFACER